MNKMPDEIMCKQHHNSEEPMGAWISHPDAKGTKYIRADKVEELVEALREIANEDYRGNRSSGSVKAYKALQQWVSE